jgi:hypothetical protein
VGATRANHTGPTQLVADTTSLDLILLPPHCLKVSSLNAGSSQRLNSVTEISFIRSQSVIIGSFRIME